jgi:peptidyl-prolyl cis-trans isomerase C
MKQVFKLALGATLVTLAFAGQAQNAVTVNGKGISSKMVDLLLKQQAQGKLVTPEQRKDLISRLVDMEVLAQDGAKKGLATGDVEMELALMKTNILARAALKNYQDKNPVTDAEAQASYDKQVKGMGGKEYQARHILVDDEAQAKDIIAKLKAGGKFEELVKVSKDTGSAAQGGDLGFANPANYVKPFADAIVALKKGELTQTPVKSEFGFHVIELTDVRDAKPPAFEEVKGQIKEGLAQEKLAIYQKGLRDKAVVK